MELQSGVNPGQDLRSADEVSPVHHADIGRHFPNFCVRESKISVIYKEKEIFSESVSCLKRLSASLALERERERERGLDFEKCEGLERSGDLLKFKIGCDEDSE